MRSVLLALCVTLVATPLRGQGPPPGVAARALVVDAPVGGSAVVTPFAMATGDRVVVWVESDVEVARPDAGGRPVPDAPAGAVVARFGGGRPFAWPERPTVWTAPRPGRLAFGLNGRAAHGFEGGARLSVVRLDAATRAAFRPPAIELDRVDGGVAVRWVDRAGFGVDARTLSFRLTTAHGTVHDLGPWSPLGDGRAVLPLPPPVELPPGIHVLSATITDRLGNRAPRSTITFHTGS